MITIILAIVAGMSLVFLAGIVWRKLPQVRVVDPSSSREGKVKERKRAILEDRLTRQTQQHYETAKRVAAPAVQGLRDAFRRIAGKLTAIERRYQEQQRKGTKRVIDPTELRRMVDEAKTMIVDGRYDPAEKLLIQVLSIDPKYADAYEAIARIYIATKNFENARESLQYLVRLSPKDPSVLASLGELAELEGKAVEALDYYRKAKELSPNNPKYLDFFITAAADAGDVLEASRALDHLREVNPDNQKIVDFEAVIAHARQINKGEEV
ncbi:MAG: tetratricopeptide repeat protein [Candidatus Uhrbacteria bacterium]|nr:tetratricopeptide repeat protein [Candidatus Uhrbacteria bacterium]